MKAQLQFDISSLGKLDICVHIFRNIYFDDQEMMKKRDEILNEIVKLESKLDAKIDKELEDE